MLTPALGRLHAPSPHREGMDNTCSIAGAVSMVLGCGLYFLDTSTSVRHWHLYLVPAMILMALGAVLALVGELRGKS